MTDKKDAALRLALEALSQIAAAMPFPVATRAIAAIREALGEPQQREVTAREDAVLRRAALRGARVVDQPKRTGQYSDIVSDGGMDPRETCRSPYCECPRGMCANGKIDMRGMK